MDDTILNILTAIAWISVSWIGITWACQAQKMKAKRAIEESVGIPFWVCDCCYLAINGYPDQCDPADHDEPGSILPTDLDYFDWTYDESDPEQAEVIERDGTGQRTFSRSACEGCGSTLGGSRSRISGFPKR